MVMVKATKTTETRPIGRSARSGDMPDTKLWEEMGAFNEELVKAGIMEAGEGLHPSSKGARVKFSADGKVKGVVDGPFAETKELVAGFWLWKVKSKEEALAWAKRCPSPMPGEECEIELRQIFAPEEIAGVFEATSTEETSTR
jgi:hypothetical protein